VVGGTDLERRRRRPGADQDATEPAGRPPWSVPERAFRAKGWTPTTAPSNVRVEHRRLPALMRAVTRAIVSSIAYAGESQGIAGGVDRVDDAVEVVAPVSAARAAPARTLALDIGDALDRDERGRRRCRRGSIARHELMHAVSASRDSSICAVMTRCASALITGPRRWPVAGIADHEFGERLLGRSSTRSACLPDAEMRSAGARLAGAVECGGDDVADDLLGSAG